MSACEWEPSIDREKVSPRLIDADDALGSMLRSVGDACVYESIRALSAEEAVGLAQHVDGDRVASRALHAALRVHAPTERPFDRVLDDAVRILAEAGIGSASAGPSDSAVLARELALAALSRRAQVVCVLLGFPARRAIDLWRVDRSDELGEALIAALRLVGRCAEAGWIERAIDHVDVRSEPPTSSLAKLLRAVRMRVHERFDEADALATEAVAAIDGDADLQLLAFALVERMFVRSAQRRLVRGHPLLGAWEADDALSVLGVGQGASPPLHAAMLRNLADHELTARRYAEALEFLDVAASVLRRVPQAADVAGEVQAMRAGALHALGRGAEARTALNAAESLSLLTTVHAPAALLHRGAAHRAIGDDSRALPLLCAAYDGARQAHDVATMRRAARGVMQILRDVGVERHLIDADPIVQAEIARW